jgi:hypothetical protein
VGRNLFKIYSFTYLLSIDKNFIDTALLGVMRYKNSTPSGASDEEAMMYPI